MPARFFSFAAIVFSVALQLSAQTAAPTGTVTGHVTCGDTQRPARFATVLLFGVPKAAKAAAEPDPNDVAAMMAAMKSALSANLVQTQTDIAGDFSAASVAPGDYYVFASVPGYVQPLNQVQAIFESGADMSKPLPGVPMIHVAAERSVQAQAIVERGASVDGKVLWDDGSPVTRANVSLESTKSDKDKELPKEFGMLAVASVGGGGGLVAVTDDLGHFRIAGLAGGDYYLKASVQTHSEFSLGQGMDIGHMMSNTPLVVYAPAAFHKTDSKPITLHTGESVGDQLITLNLNVTHTVSGHVASAEDHHELNAGTAKITDTSDKTFSRSASVDATGAFSITFVPSGTYTLEISDAEDTEPAKKKASSLFTSSHTLRSYQDTSSTVIVADADLPGQNFELKPAKKTKQDVDMNAIMKGLTGEDDDKPSK
jgi:hypothetical protein